MPLLQTRVLRLVHLQSRREQGLVEIKQDTAHLVVRSFHGGVVRKSTIFRVETEPNKGLANLQRDHSSHCKPGADHDLHP